jgi:hypothetical protein
MENITVTSATPVVDLGNLRVAVAEALASSYGAQRVYGETLNSVLPRFWFDVEHNMTGETAKTTKLEKEALYAVLKAAKHANPSVIWGRIRTYGREAYYLAETVERHATMTADEVAAELAAAEAEKVAAAGSRNKSPHLRNFDDLEALYKFNDRLPVAALTDEIVEVQKLVVLALRRLGYKFELVAKSL